MEEISRTRQKLETAKEKDAAVTTVTNKAPAALTNKVPAPAKAPPPSGPPPSRIIQPVPVVSDIQPVPVVNDTSSTALTSDPTTVPTSTIVSSTPLPPQQPSSSSSSSSPMKAKISEEDEDNMSVGNIGEEEDDENLNADQAQLKELRVQGKMMETLGDLGGAEWAYQEALRLDPLDVKTLTIFAVFLHRKRGEMSRAEAFFGRALQQCLPTLFNSIVSNAKRKVQVEATEGDQNKTTTISSNDTKIPISLGIATGETDETIAAADSTENTDTSSPQKENSPLVPDFEPGCNGNRIKNRDLIALLLKFATFLTRGQGDVEAATEVYKKAVEIEPNNSIVLGSAAHFLASEGGNRQEALILYSRALKADPSNALHALWYAKLLKKEGNLAQAEVMYLVAIQKSAELAIQQANSGANPALPTKSSSHASVEASAICNYATFVYKQRKDTERALNLFEAGIRKFTTHKGLCKNYVHLLKAQPDLQPDPAVVTIAQTKPKSKTNVLSVSGPAGIVI